MEEKKEPIKIRLSTAILSFIIFILIILIIGIFIYYNGDKIEINSNTNLINNMVGDTKVSNENETNENNIASEQKIEQLDINSETVQKLYKYILKKNNEVETIAYQSQKTTIEDLNNKVKIMTVFENLDNSEAYNTKTEKLDWGANLTHYYFKKETIENKAKEIFGENVTLTHEAIDNSLEVGYFVDYSNGIYDKYDLLQGGGIYLWEDSTQYLVNAEQSNDEIYIYDKYVHIARNEKNYEIYDIYNASDKKTKIAENIKLWGSGGIAEGISNLTGNEYSKNLIENIEKVTNKKINTFKHTFKKDSTGNYYWVSTEIVE